MTRDTAERAREWLIEWNVKQALHPSRDNCVDSLAAMLTQIQAEAREQLATWMIEHSFSTGHGDTFEDLLKELDWQVKELRGARLALLREMAAEECPACKDGAELFQDEESGDWAHERPGLPNFLCEAPEIIAERIAALAQALQSEEREGT